MQVLQTFIIHILIFVSWKKGPAFWMNIAPRFYFGLLIVQYLVVPIFIGFYTHQNWKEIKNSAFVMQLLFCGLL